MRTVTMDMVLLGKSWFDAVAASGLRNPGDKVIIKNGRRKFVQTLISEDEIELKFFYPDYAGRRMPVIVRQISEWHPDSFAHVPADDKRRLTPAPSETAQFS